MYDEYKIAQLGTADTDVMISIRDDVLKDGLTYTNHIAELFKDSILGAKQFFEKIEKNGNDIDKFTT